MTADACCDNSRFWFDSPAGVPQRERFTMKKSTLLNISFYCWTSQHLFRRFFYISTRYFLFRLTVHHTIKILLFSLETKSHTDQMVSCFQNCLLRSLKPSELFFSIHKQQNVTTPSEIGDNHLINIRLAFIEHNLNSPFMGSSLCFSTELLHRFYSGLPRFYFRRFHHIRHFSSAASHDDTIHALPSFLFPFFKLIHKRLRTGFQRPPFTFRHRKHTEKYRISKHRKSIIHTQHCKLVRRQRKVCDCS